MRFVTTLFALLSLFVAASAFSGELDNEGPVTNVQQRDLPAALPATLVVRIAQDTKAVSIVQSGEPLAADPASIAKISSMKFMDIQTTDKIQGSELDRDSSTDSWFFYFYNYSYYNPCFYYGGFNYAYSNYYWYPNGGYLYGFYHWRRW